MSKAVEIRIGTSGWSYGHWKGNFHPENIPGSKMLDFYINRLNSLEINSSFHHLPSKGAFENWRASSPDDFIFAVTVQFTVALSFSVHRSLFTDHCFTVFFLITDH